MSLLGKLSEWKHVYLLKSDVCEHTILSMRALLIGLVLMTCQLVFAATGRVARPDSIVLFDDVTRFILCHEKILADPAGAEQILEEGYFAKASPGLRAFVSKYRLTASRLASAIRSHPEDYSALSKKLEWLRSQTSRLHAAHSALGELLPSAAFLPTYFVVGAHQGIASASTDGVLISIEKGAANIVEDDLLSVFVHEHAHVLQFRTIGIDRYRELYGSGKSLLGLAIREGVAEFIAWLITGKTTQEQARAYAEAFELEVWQRFEPIMLSSETGEWMWSAPSDPKQPRDVAYAIGFLIVKHVFDTSVDKQAAVQCLLSVEDYEAYLAGSRYAAKFAKK